MSWTGTLSVNLNDRCSARLTEAGRAAFVEFWGRYVPDDRSIEPNVDEDGWTYLQLWELVQIFGDKMYSGGPQLLEDNEVRLHSSRYKGR